LLGSVRTVDPIPIELTRSSFGKVAVPDHVGLFRKGDAIDLTPARNVKEAKLDFFRVFGIESEVDPFAVPR
jgi:hypothetical protein